MRPNAPPIRRVQHIGIKVRDLDEAMVFYRDVMGFQVSDRYEPGDNPHSPWGICFMRSGDLHHEISLLSHLSESGPPPKIEALRDPGVGLHHMAFEVDSKDDFEAWGKHIRDLGIEIVHGPVVHSPTHPEGDGPWARTALFTFTIRPGTESKFLPTWRPWTLHRIW